MQIGVRLGTAFLHKMLILILYVGLLCACGVDSKYRYQPKIKGWIKQHHVVATWTDAAAKCRQEDNAILASPITVEMRIQMVELIRVRNVPHFIGVYALTGEEFVSAVEGVPLEDMPVGEMIDSLDTQKGLCMSMDRYTISAVSCSQRLPYLCFKSQEESTNECGTYASGYKLNPETGKCYKLHTEAKNWNNAYSTCVKEGAHLVVINNEVEARVIHNATSNLPFVYIGLKDLFGGGDWGSVHGHRVEQIYNDWDTQESPSDAYRCGSLRNSGKLSFGYCGEERPYMCEADPSRSRFAY